MQAAMLMYLGFSTMQRYAACAFMQVQALYLQGNPHDIVRVTRGVSSSIAALLLAWMEMYM